jgi:SAM-dependent methyltransferase
MAAISPIGLPERLDLTPLLRGYVDRRLDVPVISADQRRRIHFEEKRIRRVLSGFAGLAGELAGDPVPARRLLVIGVDSGVETIGASHIFDAVEQITFTDHDQVVVDHARQRLAAGARTGVELRPMTISIAALGSIDRRFDLVYANLLNAPFSDCPETRAARAVAWPTCLMPAAAGLLERDDLAAHFLTLHAARSLLRPGGRLLLLVGGRHPFRALKMMGGATGFVFDVLASGFKEQIDADAVIPAYARAEDHRTPFLFYPADEANEVLRRSDNLPNDMLERCLAAHRLTAREAAEHLLHRVKIGHTYYLFTATRPGGQYS